MQTSEIIEALRLRHPQSAGRWATVVEFCQVDFLAVGCWVSDNFVVHGYEIKSSRGDWLRELKAPRKADMSMGRCDHWWLAAPAGILKPGELPDGWGHVEISVSGRARAKVKAPLLRQPADRRNYLPDPDGAVANRRLLERESFAMMARRLAYADADRAALGGILDTMVGDAGFDEPERIAALDQAAIATGRHTSKQRKAQRSRTKRNRRVTQQHNAHAAHAAAGEPHSLECPLEWCRARAADGYAAAG